MLLSKLLDCLSAILERMLIENNDGKDRIEDLALQCAEYYCRCALKLNPNVEIPPY